MGDGVGQPAQSLGGAGDQPDNSPSAPAAREQARQAASGQIGRWDADVDVAGQMHDRADQFYKQATDKQKLDAVDAKLDKIQRKLDLDTSALATGVVMRQKAGGGPDDLSTFAGAADRRLVSGVTDRGNYQDELTRQRSAWKDFRRDLEKGAIRHFHDNTGEAVHDGRSFVQKARTSVDGAQGSEGFHRAAQDVNSGGDLRQSAPDSKNADQAIDKASTFYDPTPRSTGSGL